MLKVDEDAKHDAYVTLKRAFPEGWDVSVYGGASACWHCGAAARDWTAEASKSGVFEDETRASLYGHGATPGKAAEELIRFWNEVKEGTHG